MVLVIEADAIDAPHRKGPRRHRKKRNDLGFGNRIIAHGTDLAEILSGVAFRKA
jgi:hypothetical protein